MPKMTKGEKVRRSELPDTLKRSGPKAQRTFAKAHDVAVEQYGEGERAHRTAYASLKHSFEKVGDHWEPKDGKGPSDPQARQGGRQARERPKKTAGGIDVEGSSKSELYEEAKKLGIEGRSKMNRRELASAIRRKA